MQHVSSHFESVLLADDVNKGPYDTEVVSDAVSALFDKVGQGILVTHSQGGGPGWMTAIKNSKVRAVVAYEPDSGFVFPEGEVPASMPNSPGTLVPLGISLSDFMQLTKIPIIIYYGDNIPDQVSANVDMLLSYTYLI